MDPCELVDEWQDLTAQERLEILEELINEQLDDLGYESVATEIDELPGRYGEYKNGHIRFDDEHLEGEDVIRVIKTAFHEMGHAMEDQDGDYDALTDDERDHYNDEYLLDESVPDMMNFKENDFHPDIMAFADYMTDQFFQNCQSVEQPRGEVYGTGSDFPTEMETGADVVEDELPDGDVDLAAKGEIEFEPDFENAVFSTGGTNE